MAVSVTSLVAVVAFATVFGNAVANSVQHPAAVHFGYNGTLGPDKWGNLSSTFEKCNHGKSQSPINIIKNITYLNKKLKPLIRDYKSVNTSLVNNGVNIGMHFSGDVGGLVIDGKNYGLLQLHWHSPSEHHIEGVTFPLELHLVHLSEEGNFSVVGYLYQYGEPDPFLAQIKEPLEKLAKDAATGNQHSEIQLGILNTKCMRKRTRKYYRYVGSLTTPPCTEDILWNIIGKVRTVSKEQVEALKAPLSSEYKSNCRPCQPVNGRHVELYNELAS